MTLPRRSALGFLLLPGLAHAAELDMAALMARLAAVPGRQATFRETRRFAALDQPLESMGRLTYRRPGYVEKETTWPEPERLVMDGDRLVLTAGNEPPRVVDLSSQPELRVLVEAIRGPLAGDLAALRRAFSVRAGGTPEAWRLELAPLDPRAGRLLRRVAIAGTGTEVTEVLTSQANGDEQRMTITATP